MKYEVSFSNICNTLLGSFKPCPHNMNRSVGPNCFDDSALHLHQDQKHQADYTRRFAVARGADYWEIPLLNNVCVWFLGMPPNAKCISGLYWWAQRIMDKLLHAALSHFGTHIRRQVGKSDAAFLWMEGTRLHGTLIALRNPIHMAPCTRETSDNQETACQENNNSSLFNLITATGTYNSTQAGVHWVDACY